jgi:hypothetical protein
MHQLGKAYQQTNRKRNKPNKTNMSKELTTKTKLTLQEIVKDENFAIELDSINHLLNQEVPPAWLVAHPFVKSKGKPLMYLPIDKVEYLLTKIFLKWKVEVLSVTQLFNSVAVTIRLHYYNIATGEMSYHDGVGAVGIQTDKGASASDLSSIKADAVMKALPAAKSYAIKDAADHLGKLFGRDVGRSNTLSHSISHSSDENPLEMIKTLLDGTEVSDEEYINIQRIITNQEKDSYQKAITLLKSK